MKTIQKKGKKRRLKNEHKNTLGFEKRIKVS